MNSVKTYLGIVFGSAMMALAIPAFITGSAVVPGGVAGAAVLLARFTAIPTGVTVLVLCSIIFVFGWRMLGTQCAKRTLVAYVCYALFTDLFSTFVPRLTTTDLGSVLAGGLLAGAGLGIILHFGGSLSTTDLIAKMVFVRLRIPVSATIMVLDCLPVALAAVLLGVRSLVYSILVVAMLSIVVELCGRISARIGSTPAPERK